MATISITTTVNIDSLTRGTADAYIVNGGSLTIDQDSRYGKGGDTNFLIASMAVSATSGGTLLIDARFVRLIPFTGGSGVVPAYNTVISKGSATGIMIGVWPSLTSPPISPGAAMPVSGFIKIKQWNSIEYTSGALTGISANGSPSVTGWIELVGADGGTLGANRLGTVSFLGAWYNLGTTTGVSGQTFQIPTSGSSQYIPGVFIEQNAGIGDYEFYANAGSATAIAADDRAKVVFIDTTGTVAIGYAAGASAGYTPPAGLRVVWPNINLQTCIASSPTINASPNANLSSRFKTVTTGGGVITIDKISSVWTLQLNQPYYISLSNSALSESLVITGVSQPATISRVGVGQLGSNIQTGFVLANCTAGMTITNCYWSRYSLTTTQSAIATYTDCSYLTVVGETVICMTPRAYAASHSHYILRVSNSTWTNTKITIGRFYIQSCINLTVTGVRFCDVISGITVTTAVQNAYMFDIGLTSQNIEISNISIPITDTQPYLGIAIISKASNDNIRFRNIGTFSNPLNLGTTTAIRSGYFITTGTGASSSNIRVQRCYVYNTRTNFHALDNTVRYFIIENCSGDYNGASTNTTLDSRVRAFGQTPLLSGQSAVYGTHFNDTFDSPTSGRFSWLMNEHTNDPKSIASYNILGGNPAFTSTGSIVMQNIGDSIEFVMQYYAIGHTGFSASPPTMIGSTISNYTISYSLDKNDGAGWSPYTLFSTTAISSETGIDPVRGVAMKLRITTSTASSQTFSSISVATTSTAFYQENALYPLDTNSVSLTGLIAGSEVRAYVGTDPISSTAIAGIESSSTSFSFNHSSAGLNGYIQIFSTGQVPIYLPILYQASNISIPIQQRVDRNFKND